MVSFRILLPIATLLLISQACAFVLLRTIRQDSAYPLYSPLTKNHRVALAYQSSDVESETDDLSVLYQKIVRAPQNIEPHLFLSTLVEYIQDRFELPSRLPMVYEAKTLKDSKSVVQWDSSLSPSSDQTCLEVQVVAVFPENQSASTNLAMVVVGKRPKTGKFLPPLLRNLFEDSEKQILKSLDRGLEIYMSGKISFASPKRNSYAEAKQSILAEIMESEGDPESTNKSRGKVTDAEIISQSRSVSESSEGRKQVTARQVIEANVTESSTSSTTIDNPPGLDFAVEQAKLAAKRIAERKSSGNFAVDAAKKAAAKMRQDGSKDSKTSREDKHETKVKEGSQINLAHELPHLEKGSPVAMDMTSIRPPSLDLSATGKPRAFMHTISRPSDFLRNQTRSSETEDNQVAAQGKRRINLSIRQEESSLNISQQELIDDQDDITEPLQKEMIKATQDALSEISEQGEELTPEELLNQVMRFGEEQDNDSAIGAGFVSGAFEKAKDLLREQRQKREERLMHHVVEKAASEVRTRTAETVDIKGMSIEEELRRMFEAGEHIADGRLKNIEKPGSVSEEELLEKQDEVDTLISLEKSISSHARILDDELAELEIRINKSPGEELDGFSKAPMFDIFSGPELYNPNVDPETAVNWPGTLPGTGTVKFPKELDEALKQARFASEVLQNVKEVRTESTHGTNVTKYVVGNRELTDKQVENMRLVVTEAVNIGLIDDPLIKMKEASQLQMLLDELWDQPEERHNEITSNYKDLLLSDNFVALVKERLNVMADRDLEALRRGDDNTEATSSRERQLLGELVVSAQLLLKEAQALGAELEAQQLEVIRSICKVAMDPKHQTEEETARALTEGVRDMRPLFDDAFIAYLKYAVAEEEARLARAGLLDDPEHNQWLFVLKIVQQGVYAELSRGISRYIDHIGYVLRMETAVERKLLLKKLIDVMPSLDVRPFVQVVDNIIGSLGDSVRGNFDGSTALGEMTNKLLQLHRDMKELLPEERIALMSRDADEWAQRQRQKLMETRAKTQKLLQAARETEHLDGEVESLVRRGEVDRYD